MGEQADLIIDGVMCQSCGAFIGEAIGYPRCCEMCTEDDENDRVASYRAMRAERRDRGERRRETASEWFEQQGPIDVAGGHTIIVRRCSDAHYRITHGERTWNVWPGNCRIGQDHGKFKFLDLPSDWTMQDVVDAIRKAFKD